MPARAPRLPLITLTTDFGTRDAYVASMKGVILSAAPEARIVDISHEIPPQGIVEAGFVLACAFEHFPPGTIHVLVVDPGVGTDRRLLGVRTRRHAFLAPDNGCLGLILAAEPAAEIVRIATPPETGASISPTFHGRDILAPAAARLALGAGLAEIGIPAADPLPFPVAPPQREMDGRMRLTVLSVDRFGNLILNHRRPRIIPPGGAAAPGKSLSLEIAGRRISRLVETYAQAGAGEAVLLFNSSGYLEVAIPGGSAAAALGCAQGTVALLTS